MSFQVVDCCRNRLCRRTLVERRFRLLSALPSVAVHVVGAQMVVVDADGLPLAVLEEKQDDRVALDWLPDWLNRMRIPSPISISIVRS